MPDRSRAFLSENSHNGYYFETATERKAEHKKSRPHKGICFNIYFACIKVGFQGLRMSKKRSILDVCEHFYYERNAENSFKTTKLLSNY